MLAAPPGLVADSSTAMTVELGWDAIVLAALLAALLMFLGATAEYLWHSVHHRRH